MTIKTFNVDDDTYQKFSSYCKENGLSMSKQITWFMKTQVEEELPVRKEYLAKIERLRKGKFIKIDDLEKRYGLK